VPGSDGVAQNLRRTQQALERVEERLADMAARGLGNLEKIITARDLADRLVRAIPWP
jgi:hypothetical protein